jgi:glycosyltransferase involved in cell wall biosynthesis
LGINSVVLYPPVEVKPKKVKKENIILHVGRFRVRDVATGIDDYKKQGFMVDIFKKMIKMRLLDWKFVLAVSVKKDDQKIFETFKERAKGYPIEFIINKNNNNLWDIYSKAKIYWHATGFGRDLQKHPELAEHFGISTVEAMGAGAVPVVFNAGGQNEIVTNGENGFLWNRLDELIEKTQLLINNEKLFLQMSDNAIRKARDFAGDRFCGQLYKILDL